MLDGKYLDFYNQISKKLSKENIFTDKLHTLAYGTDASFYRLIPKIVIIHPKDHRERADKYSKLTAQKMFHNGKTASAIKPYLSAFGRFVAMYLLKAGFLDGKMGFKIAQISAQSNVFKYKELRRLHRESN